MGTAGRVLGRTGRALRETLLTLAALGGVACILLTILAFTGGYSLIMFKTGSMSPTIPAGSVALVQKVPATQLEVGDVTTVDRPGALPITHRITSIAPGAAPAQRVITMKGDANEAADPAPYAITSARIVRGSLPGLANVIVWFGSPLVLGGITVAAALLVTWAFWPRAGRRDRGEDSPTDADVPGDEAVGRGERRTAGLLGVSAAVAIGCAAIVPAAPAEAAPLISIRSSLSADTTYVLDASEPVIWDLDIDAGSAPRDGTLRVGLTGAGDPAMRLVAEVRGCDRAWTSAGCPSSERLLRGASALDLDGASRPLLATSTPSTVHLRLRLTASVQGEPSATAAVIIRAVAAEQVEETQLGGSAGLAATGGEPVSLLAAPAAVLVGLGIALIARRRRETR